MSASNGASGTASDREYDVVLYGATGFVGKLTAQYLAAAGSGARIALAGRSTDRLLAVRETLGDAAEDWPLIVAGRIAAVDDQRAGGEHPRRHHHRRSLPALWASAGGRLRGCGHRLRGPDR